MAGQVFDSSQRRGGPVSRRADQSIPGISQALQMMKPGSKWEVAIPSNLAYGRKGRLAHQAVLIELELIEVKESDE
jgi:FKBP-type peptidyl-prolyl cis-trans isomerase FklB